MRARESRKKNGSPAKTEARLAVNLPISIHRTLKRRAAETGTTMRELILDLLARAGIE
jgi:hypothetical protein